MNDFEATSVRDMAIKSAKVVFIRAAWSLAGTLVGILLTALAVKLLWNGILPQLYLGWPTISYLQALGLMVLTQGLTKGSCSAKK